MKSKGNVVFVSEYNAPEDFELVWQGEIKTNFSSTRKSATHNAVEKLFKVWQPSTLQPGLHNSLLVGFRSPRNVQNTLGNTKAATSP